MSGFIEVSAYVGVTISLVSYFFGMLLKKKLKLAIFNPLLISVVFTIAFLVVTDTSYTAYESGAGFLSWLLTPATISLAIPLYEQLELLKKYRKAIALGILTGVLTSLLCVLAICLLFGLSHTEYVTFLPKSVTSAIGMGISEELGGYVSITVAVIIITGILGNMMSPFILRTFHITEPIAKGIAIGTSSHAIGTAKAMEMGEVEGAFSSLSIVIAGLMTVVGANIFQSFI